MHPNLGGELRAKCKSGVLHNAGQRVCIGMLRFRQLARIIHAALHLAPPMALSLIRITVSGYDGGPPVDGTCIVTCFRTWQRVSESCVSLSVCTLHGIQVPKANIGIRDYTHYGLVPRGEGVKGGVACNVPGNLLRTI